MIIYGRSPSHGIPVTKGGRRWTTLNEEGSFQTIFMKSKGCHHASQSSNFEMGWREKGMIPCSFVDSKQSFLQTRLPSLQFPVLYILGCFGKNLRRFLKSRGVSLEVFQNLLSRRKGWTASYSTAFQQTEDADGNGWYCRKCQTSRKMDGHQDDVLWYVCLRMSDRSSHRSAFPLASVQADPVLFLSSPLATAAMWQHHPTQSPLESRWHCCCHAQHLMHLERHPEPAPTIAVQTDRQQIRDDLMQAQAVMKGFVQIVGHNLR